MAWSDRAVHRHRRDRAAAAITADHRLCRLRPDGAEPACRKPGATVGAAALSAEAGHRPIVLAGGATGLIGDPRDSGERTMNTADTVARVVRTDPWSSSSGSSTSTLPGPATRPTPPSSRTISVGPSRWAPSSSCAVTSASTSRSTSCSTATPSAGASTAGISYTEVQLHAPAGQRLRGTAPAARLLAADRRIRPVGQHHRRQRATGPAEARRDGARADGAAGDADGTKFGKSTGGGGLWLDPR